MAKALTVLFVSSEVYPFAKNGGLADVTFSLPLALRSLGHDVRVMLPKYGSVSERKNRIHEINRLKDIPVPIGKIDEPATVKSSSITNPRVKVQAYVATNYTYFDSRKGIYNDPDTWEEYSDNAERFIFFNRSVMETCILLGWFPDIIHCNDWQSALVGAYVKELFPLQFEKTKIVFTVHNALQQGEFPLSKFNFTGLPKKVLANFKHKNKFNFLKGALHYADFVTTVSKTYAEDLKVDKDLSNGLNTVFKNLNDNFQGILNGIETWVWNPRKDDFIDTKYDGNIEEFKYNNKVALINKFGFEYSPKTPIISMITRIDKQKGVDLFIKAADKILKKDVQFIFLGEGDADMKESLKILADKYPDKLKLDFAFDDQLAHMIEAGSDMFLMPSKYEPCGLNLMYSIAYGTIPIVHYTGGLCETAVDFDPETEEGNAIVYKDHTVKALVDAVDKGLDLFQKKMVWEEFTINNLETARFSWDKTVDQYDKIYSLLVKEAK